MRQISSEKNRKDYCQSDEIDIVGLLHPDDRSVSNENISKRTSSNSCHESYDEDAKDIQFLVHCCECTRKGEGNGTDEIQGHKESHRRRLCSAKVTGMPFAEK